jgi:ATP-binding cassette, subfamily B, bacterial
MGFSVYKQLDQMDCGPTCLRMVAKHYGRNYPLHELRSKSYITREGVSLLGISDAAEAIGFRTIGVKIPFDKLAGEAVLPCIVHWYQRHFVVVYKISKVKVYVADPAAGLIAFTKEEFNKGWLSTKDNGQETGVALLLETTPQFYEHEPETVKNKRKSLTYLLGYLKNHRTLLIQLILGLLTGSLIQLALPFLTQSIVDVGINTQNSVYRSGVGRPDDAVYKQAGGRFYSQLDFAPP